MKISDTPPPRAHFFKKKNNPPILPTPSFLWEKSAHPPWGGGGDFSSYGLPDRKFISFLREPIILL